MNETTDAPKDQNSSGISNTMGFAIIAMILILGGVILYQAYQLEMAMNMLELLAERIQKSN